MTLRSGGLFAGYGGLDMAVSQVFGAEPAWFSEIDDAPSKILAHHWPDVPNLGDITQIDWDTVEPVDILSGGFPCQDVSLAGKRAGMTPDTRSGLWAHFAYAISKLRPRYVVVENVRGLLSAEAHSDVEPCTWCLGDGPGEPALRALGAVLGDLADLGYDAQWVGIPASEVGAPHGRWREFILAEDANVAAGGEWRLAAPGQAEGGRARSDAGRRNRALAADADLSGSQGRQPAPGRHLSAWGTAADAAGERHRDTGAPSQRRFPAAALAGSPTDADGYALREQPVAQPGRRGATVAGLAGDPAADTSSAERRGPKPGNLGARSLAAAEPRERLGTATDADDDATWHRLQAGREGRSRAESPQRSADTAAERGIGTAAWGQYAGAIRRWERVLGRTAPAPTELNTKGSQRLSPAFVEWMMGLPAGYVTAVPGVNRNAQLKALGNGVVPQQAIAALRHMHATHELTTPLLKGA